MAVLVDTCVLLRAFERKAPEFAKVRAALRLLIQTNEPLVVTPQNIAEFWNVSTRPVIHNDLGLTAPQTRRRVAIVERMAEVISEDTNSYQVWKQLVFDLQVSGVAVHDARLAAVMLNARISRIYTLNVKDFRRYDSVGIFALNSDDILRSDQTESEAMP